VYRLANIGFSDTLQIRNMNMNKVTTMIDGVLTGMSAGKTSNATLAVLVQKQEHADVRNRICKAYVELVAERRRLQMQDKADGTATAKAMAVKPEQLLSMLQFTMNQLCWTARRVITTYYREQSEVEAGISAENMDFSAEVCEEAGIEPLDTDALTAQVEDDYASLSAVQNWLTAKGRIDYLEDVTPLALFNSSEKDEELGIWVVTEEAFDFDGALEVMEKLLVMMPEKEQAKLVESADNTDFDEDCHVTTIAA